MRRTKEVTITAEGRDQGKTFLITEMHATPGERWAARALNAMARSGYDFPPGWTSSGMAVVALCGLHAFLSADFAELEPLLEEMMACVQIVQPAATRKLIEDDIEEITTRVQLRSEVFELHAGFSITAALSPLAAVARMAAETTPDTSTSPKPSA